MISEKELLETGKYIRCVCNNVIAIHNDYCPYCHRFNAATSSNRCPTCGQELK